MKQSRFAGKTLAVLFLAIVFFFAATNFNLLAEPVEKLIDGEIEFADFTKEIAGAYRNKLMQREVFITMNGGYARASGARVSNGIILMDNGMLTEENKTEIDPSFGAGKVKELYEYLEGEGIPFLYIQSPRKPDINNELLPVGTVNESNANADKMVALLNEAGVPLMDLRPYLTANEEQINKYFYRTDHHWNVEGAFVAFELITEYIQDLFPDQEIIGQATERDNWEQHVLENYFLGSHGRRVGIGFAGVEDLIYLTPKFETELSCAVPEKLIFRKGEFAESALDGRYMEAETDYYNTNPYCVHTGNDYSHVQFRNAEATSNLKVVLIKDSFGLPLEGLLATVFQEFDTLDLRHMKTGSVKEQIRDLDPDIVMVMYNPSFAGSSDVYEFGVEEVDGTVSAKKVMVEDEYLVIPKHATGKYNHRSICDLEPGKEYTLTIENIEILSGDVDTVTICVYDAAGEKRHDTLLPDFDFEREIGEIRWIFKTPEAKSGDLSLLVYAGIAGKTEGISVAYSGISLYEGVVRDGDEIEQRPETKKKLVLEDDEGVLTMHASSQYRHKVLHTLEKGKEYTVVLDSVDLDAGTAESVRLSVYDCPANERFMNCDLDLKQDGEYRWVFRVPETRDGEVQLLIYAGTPGNTAGNGITYRGLRLYEGAVYTEEDEAEACQAALMEETSSDSNKAE